jgi:serine kinase of HPr protein (carbohydrate metabolism regulator)
MIVHAGLVALRIGGFWRGALIEGPSGSGKSDLALRCLEAGFRLVADDRVLLWTSGGRLYGRAAETLAGLIEMRGLGVLPEPQLAFSAVALIVRAGSEIERVPPENQAETRLGVTIPALDLAFLEDSAPAKLRRALYHLG